MHGQDSPPSRDLLVRGANPGPSPSPAQAVTDERAMGRIYNVGRADPVPWAEWVRMIGRAAGWDGEVVTLPSSALPPHLTREHEGYDFDQHWVVDTGRIRRELGYEESVSRDQALRKAVGWEREHPPDEDDPAEFDYAAEDDALAKLR